jgi:ABC-type glutathione transport system ATPase component
MERVTDKHEDVEGGVPPTHSNRETREKSESPDEIQTDNISPPASESSAGTPDEAALEELVPQLTRRGTINPDSPYFSTEKFLRGMLLKADQQGLKRRNAGVCFRNLVVLGYGSEFTHQNTVGTVGTGILRIKDTIRQRRHPLIKTILHAMDGLVQEGEMLLVLGKPGAGATTLLKTIAGETRGYADISGSKPVHRAYL